MIKPPTAGASDAIYTIDNGSGPVPQGPAPVIYIDGLYNSTNTPGWNSMTRRQRAVQAPWKQFEYKRDITRYGLGVARSDNFGGPPFYWTPSSTGYGGAVSGWPCNVYPSSWAEDDSGPKALSRIQSKISNSQVNLAQALGERKQTVDLITKRFRQLVELARKIRRGDLIGAGKTVLRYGANPNSKRVKGGAQALANHWLEYQYGWKPLLSDIYGAGRAIEDAHLNPRPLRFDASATFQVHDLAWLMRDGAMPAAYRRWELRAGKVAMRFHSRYVVEVLEDSSVMQSLASTGLTNPLLLAWELAPYSFVVDWAFPLGNYLQQLEYARGLTFHRGTFANRRSASGELSMSVYQTSNNPDPGHLVCNGTYEGGYLNWYEKSRSILSSFPYQKFPSFHPKLGAERALSAISLLTQVFTKGTPSRR